MKSNFNDLTILIPVRIDSIIRLENLLAVIDYLYSYFTVNIIVLEADRQNNKILAKLLPPTVNHIFEEDLDPVFYRTHYINKMIEYVTTPFVAVWDADVVFPNKQVIEAMKVLRAGLADVVFPYDGRFLDVSKLIREHFIINKNLDSLTKYQDKMNLLYGTEMRGGAFIIDTQLYKKSGVENEFFYGWGPEDWERCERWSNLNYRLKTIEGILYHLSHPRNMNGQHNSDLQKRISFYELHTTEQSSIEEIRRKLNLD